ncbi:MAG: chromosome segregation protein SMC [candidate division WOR-3 bacterium]
MYIKELQLLGFKSFQEKTTLRFAPGMNCIIGPNGCGKSNVLDALRWVLGEQSFAVLRCAKNEDLIFAGTAQLPPVNFAEVRLILSTEDQPALGSEVEIRRRYFRSGESEYYLNRQPCRLRDIQDLFLSTGIGTKAYSIFDLRQMREIIAGNIRQMFEEAATLAKFRDSKEECQRKLTLTQTDLTRLEDIIAERERIVRSLQRQSARLRVYQRLKQEESQLRLRELQQAYRELNEQLAANEQEIRKLEDAAAELTLQIRHQEEELRQLHSRLVGIQSEREQALNELNQRRQTLAELQARLLMEQQESEFLDRTSEELQKEKTRLEQEINELQQIFNTALNQLENANSTLRKQEAELQHLQTESRQQETTVITSRQEEEQERDRLRQLWENEQQLRGKIIRLEAELANNKTTTERLTEEARRLRQQLNQAETDRNTLQSEFEHLKNQLDYQRQQSTLRQQELAAIERQLAELGREQRHLEEQRTGNAAQIARLETRVARSVLAGAREILGDVTPVSDWLEPDPGWERACEAAFNFLLDFLNTETIQPAELKRLLDRFPTERFGLLINSLATAPVPESPPPADPAIIGTLHQFVRLRTGAPALLRSLLESFAALRNSESLGSMIEKYPASRFVTADGYAYLGNGRLVLAGEQAGSMVILSRIRELEHSTAALNERLAAIEKTAAHLNEQRLQLQAQLDQAESELRLTEREFYALESRLSTTAGVAAELQREYERLNAEIRRLNGLTGSITTALAEHQQELTALRTAIEQSEQKLAGLEQRSNTAEQQVKNELKAASELLAQLAEQRARVRHLETEMSHIKQSIEDKSRRIREITATMTRHHERQQQLKDRREQLNTAINQLQAQLAEAEQSYARFNLDDVSAATAELEKNIAELRNQQQNNQNRLLEYRLQRAELETRVRALLDEAKSLGADLSQFSPAPAESADELNRLEEIRRRLAALGPVNPLAAEEYEQEKKDLERLLFQRDDVLQAKQNLEESLKEIDRHAREQFLNTYREVRLHFQQVFRELFLEGDADLVLVNDADPLQSEIAIIARPRGKNPKRLEQLSDGEKALLAISLLFAFYRVKPAPFCFLDEIDAPLDDANVSRFADYLKRMTEKTQVIIITHNRATVERADVIFGVTAEQPGVSKLISVSLADYRRNNPASPLPEN